MDEIQETQIRVADQGAVRVNAAHIYRSAEGIVCIYLDMHSKRVVMDCTSSSDDDPPRIYLSADENTLHLDKTQPRNKLTEVEFVDFVGWRVFASDSARYTIAVCLVAPDESPNVKYTPITVYNLNNWQV